jgi:sucrose-phosphate synthase
VVATSNGGPREITDEGNAGLLADPHDPTDIAAKLLRLLSEERTWQTYADRGRERARRVYSWGRTAEGYLTLADEISQGHRRGDTNFPLPEFIRRPYPLPRLDGWETG